MSSSKHHYMATALCLLPLLLSNAAAQPRVERRLFDWEDAMQRVEVETAVVSPDGATLAVQVTRPLAAAGTHAGARRLDVQPRGDLWLYDRSLAHGRKLFADNRWVWAASFSPSGRKIAALLSQPDGQVGFGVWDTASGQFTQWLQYDADVHPSFSAGNIAELRQEANSQYPQPFVWLDEQRLLFVERNGIPQQYTLAPLSAARTYATLREKTLRGEVSVRVWNDDSPSEGSHSRLATLDVVSGAFVPYYAGDVRGVAVSPDRLQAALLVATRHVQPSTATVDPPLRSLHLLDDNVSMQLVFQSLTHAERTRTVADVSTIGVAAPSRLPLWSADGRTVALATRATYSAQAADAGDAAWLVDVAGLRARKFDARSALDAELLANMLSAGWPAKLQTLDKRPVLSAGPASPALGDIRGRVWRLPADRVLLWDRQRVLLVSRNRIVQVPGDFYFARAVELTSSPQRFLLSSKSGTTQLQIDGERFALTPVTAPADASLLTSSNDAALLYKADTAQGTSLHVVAPDAPPISVMAFNTHFSGIAEPTARELSLEVGGRQLTAVLRLPPKHEPGQRHPVIIMAYPQYHPRRDDSLNRLNSTRSVIYPFQHLLSRGFAVCFVPFPVDAMPESGPLQMAVDAVTAWLSLLDAQPEILPGEFGYWGHSNGGYVGLALEARTQAFKAIAVASTFPDLQFHLSAGPEHSTLESSGSGQQARRWVYEHGAQPYTLGPPPWRNLSHWIDNSPVFNLQQASTPMLLLVGEFDFGGPRPMEQVYSILRGQGVPVEMAQYWGEPHVISSPGNLHDMWLRSEAFFRQHLRMQ